MRCPKCNGLMHVALDNKETFAKSCMTCGNWVETPRIVLPMDETMTATGQAIANRPNNFKKPTMKPCPVVGCENTMRVDSDKPMCRMCHKKMYEWLKSGSGKLPCPPVMEVNGKLWLRSYYDKTKGEKAA